MQFQINFILSTLVPLLVALMHEFPCTHQFTQAGNNKLSCLMNFTWTLGFISVCAAAASASVCEACNVMTIANVGYIRWRSYEANTGVCTESVGC